MPVTGTPRSHRREPLKCWRVLVAAFTLASAAAYAAKGNEVSSQPLLGSRSVQLLRSDGLTFKDLDHNDELDIYEDWRQAPEARARDLVRRLRIEELAGMLLHGNIASTEAAGPNARGEYDFDRMSALINSSHVNSFITRYNAEPRLIAAANNRLQALAEATRLGIPLTISSDPRSHIQFSALTTVRAGAFSKWPEPTGLAAIGDPSLVRQFADIVRQEYLAVGIREGLSPQADLATEPRWSRLNGTFGEDAQVAKQMVEAYVAGMQNGAQGLNRGSVAAIVKHWVGYGAQENGLDSHNSYGQNAVFPSHNFDYHIIPFTGAFAANAAGVMPTYSILRGVSVSGKPVEAVGAGFNRQLLTDLLRKNYGFKGVIVTDWSITMDCGNDCEFGAPAGQRATFADLGMPWGVEHLSKEARFSKAINAGVDQIGGSDEIDVMLAAVKRGYLSRSRLEQSAYRILLQKFQLGLFEDPYADEDRANSLVGNASFVAQGEDAQRKSLVLLENRNHLLPYSMQGKKVYLSGLDPTVAASYGLVPVDSLDVADLAIIRATTPSELLHPSYALGRIQHEGRLDFRSGDSAYDLLVAASKLVPTIFVVEMNRPAILVNVKDKATALLASFGVADKALLDLLAGKVAPQAHLPFELPSSMEEVLKQKEDLPHDSAHPLYSYGYGMTY